MSSYWSKRRKVVSSVQDHVDAIYNSVNTPSCDTDTEDNHADDISLGSRSPPSPPQPNAECCAPVELGHLPESAINVSEDVAIVEDEMAAGPLVFDEIDFDLSGNSSDDSGDSDFPDIDLATLLVSWVSKFNISHLALNGLLCILREYHTYLPKDARTLLKTAKQYNVLNIAGGCYYHFGIENWVKSVVSSLDVCTGNVIEVSL